MGGFGGASIQKAQSLIDLGSSRYEYLTHITLSTFSVGFYLISLGLIQVFFVMDKYKYLDKLSLLLLIFLFFGKGLTVFLAVLELTL